MEAPITYPGAHGGPRRTLTLTTKRGMMAAGAVHVSIDGSTYVLPWGTAAFEVPADRPVTVGVHQMGRTPYGVANATLTPEATAELEYRGPAHRAMAGELGPPGSVRSRGVALQAGLLAVLAVLGVLVVWVVVVLIL